MSRMLLILVVIVILLISIVIIMAVANSVYKNPLPRGMVKIGEEEFRVDIADNMLTRERGLSGREKLGPNEGMLFIFPYSGPQAFWMKDMKFALDMVWIADDAIVGITENVPPPSESGTSSLLTYPSPQSVNKVLEVNAGTASRLGWKAGDKIEIGL